MEKIMIKDRDNSILLYLNNNTYYGYTNNNNINVFDYFNYFKLSKNIKIIGSYKEYTVVLDNNSGLRHYVKDEIDNMELLFFKNGYSAVSYVGHGNKKDKYKVFRFRNIVITITCLGLIMANGLLLGGKSLDNNLISYNEISDYQLSDLRDMIYSSNRLTIDEKQYLYNEEFLSDVLECVNKYNHLKLQYMVYFNNIGISGDYREFEKDNGVYGYYLMSNPNTMYVRNYEELNEINKDTVSHEFVHLCQDTSGYNLIIEACAEIISHEYYSDNKISSYVEQVNLVKKLMEIIGSDVVWYYNFTGDFSKIEERVKPYLSSSEYREFLNDLTFDYNNYGSNRPKYDSLNELLAKLYRNIYNDDIDNNIIISLVDRNDNSLVRYYFNNRHKSFYYNYSQGEYKDISYEEAVNEKLIFINAIYKEHISKEEAFQIIDAGNYPLSREIDYHKNNISVYASLYTPEGLYISAIIDGVRYQNVSVDDLVKDGIIEVNYYLVDNRLLSASEYLNHEYRDGAEIIISKLSDTELKEDSVYTFIPKKVYIPSLESNKVKVYSKKN